MIQPEEMKLAQTVARTIGSKWKLVEIDDLESHLYLWLVENERHLVRWREEEGDGKLFVSLRREAAKYCAKETKEKVHTDDLDTNNYYSNDIIYKALPFIFEFNKEEYELQNKEKGLAYDILTDISTAYWGLPVKHRDLIALKYKQGLSFNEIGEMYQISENTATKRVHRSIEKLYSSLAGQPLRWLDNRDKNKISYESL